MAFLEYIPLKPMYHYTTELGLRGILSSRELWLSDLGKSNDPRDIELGLETLKTLTKEIGEKEYSIENAKVLFQITKKMVGYFGIARCYTACFSPIADSLNMWREYGGQGNGYSIGFRSRAITDMQGRIYKVRYIDDTSRDDLYNLISEIVKPIEIHGKTIFENPEMELEISTALISIVNSLKHITWEYENEVRLTFASGDSRPPNNIPLFLNPDGKDVQWRPHKIRNQNGLEIKYHSLPFGKFSKSKNDHRESIVEVIIGPKATLSQSDVKELLLDNGFSNFDIKPTSCAFR